MRNEAQRGGILANNNTEEGFPFVQGGGLLNYSLPPTVYATGPTKKTSIQQFGIALYHCGAHENSCKHRTFSEIRLIIAFS